MNTREAAVWMRAMRRYGLGAWRSPATEMAFLRSWLRYPYEYSAEQDLALTPELTLADIAGADTIDDAGGLVGRLDRVRRNVRLDEQFALGVLIRRMRPRRLFEIGTFDGDTTRYLAQVAGSDAHIWTLDYSPDEFDRVNHFDGFSGRDIGRAFRGMPEASRITQLSGDSGTFDFSPYAASMDIVFVDATHNYAMGLRDSATALKLARPGGWVIWHDYWTQWPGVVRAIREVAVERNGLALFRVAGMRLALVQAGVASQEKVRATLARSRPSASSSR